MNQHYKKTTLCIHNRQEQHFGSVVPPVFLSTSYPFPNEHNEVIYPRSFNTPTQLAVSSKIAELEGGEKGLVLASGMGAISAVLFSFLKAGDHAIFHSELYGGTQSFAANELTKYNISCDTVFSTDLNDFKKAIKPNTKLIFFETPTNPLLSIIDLSAMATLAKSHQLITVVDNTFATPINQNPLHYGIDIVIHSGTKYLNGHSDVNCGAIVTSKHLMETILPVASLHGSTLDTHACYLLDRGLKTLALRIERHNDNATRISEFLSQASLVKQVYYPGLKTHPDHLLARKQMSGNGGMVSFELDLPSETIAERLPRLSLFHAASSLGGVESLISLPVQSSHRKMDPAMREKIGIKNNVIRLSVGIEDCDDLIDDLKEHLIGKRR